MCTKVVTVDYLDIGILTSMPGCKKIMRQNNGKSKYGSTYLRCILPISRVATTLENNACHGCNYWWKCKIVFASRKITNNNIQS